MDALEEMIATVFLIILIIILRVIWGFSFGVTNDRVAIEEAAKHLRLEQSEYKLDTISNNSPLFGNPYRVIVKLDVYPGTDSSYYKTVTIEDGAFTPLITRDY